MNKHFARMLAIGVTAATVAGPVLPAFAAGTNYTAVNGGTTDFSKYFIVDSESTVPNITFNYTIATGNAHAYDVAGKKVAVYAGSSATGSPVIKGVAAGATATATDNYSTDNDGKIIFGKNDTKIAKAAKPNTDNVNLEDSESYVKKTATIDFSGVSFSEPGIYRWIVTETDDKAQGVSYDTQVGDGYTALSRYLDVYVTDDGTGKLVVSAYVLHKNDNDVVMNDTNGSGDVKTDAGKLADKSDGYVNAIKAHDLTISKAVSGNQASHDKYFKVVVKLTNTTPGSQLNVDISNADATVADNAATETAYKGQTNPATIDIGTDGTNGTDGTVFYLHNGQSIKINGITDKTTYTVTETEEDYKPSIAVTGDQTNATADDLKDTIFADTVTDKALNDDTTVAITNTRNGVIPTGVVLSMAPYLIAAGVAGVGIAAAKKKKKNEEDAE